MKYSEEEQKYMADMEKAFEEQKDVQFRKLSMTKERYQQLAYTYCKITDEEEMKDFAYISTHEDVRLFYLSDTNLALLERIDGFKFPKHPIERCIRDGGLVVSVDFPSSFKISNLRDIKDPPKTPIEIVLDILLGLPLKVLKWLLIFLALKLLLLPLDEIASAYLASHPL